jgi:hypothetical protein
MSALTRSYRSTVIGGALTLTLTAAAVSLNSRPLWALALIALVVFSVLDICEDRAAARRARSAGARRLPTL